MGFRDSSRNRRMSVNRSSRFAAGDGERRASVGVSLRGRRRTGEARVEEAWWPGSVALLTAGVCGELGVIVAGCLVPMYRTMSASTSGQVTYGTDTLVGVNGLVRCRWLCSRCRLW
jgi:hypothetical protein